MVRSLRWRLQAWHALILLAVVVGFGSVLYLQVKHARFDDIDSELLAGARVLEGVLRTMPRDGFLPDDGLGPEPFEGRPPRFHPPPHLRDDPEAEFFPPHEGPFRRLPIPRIEHQRRFRRALTLPTSLTDRYPEDWESPYFAIYRDDGELFAAEPDPPGVPFSPETMAWDRERHGRQRGVFREVILRGPDHTQIIVGRDIGRELASMHRLGLQLALSGLAVFGVGLLGGWWLSSRAVASIRDMSDAVAGISADNLSRRVDLHDVDTELGELATIINHMLGRLEASFVQQSRFTADASHELRTPLSVLMTQVDLALTRPRTPEEYQETLAACRRAGTRMKSLVDDLLTLARADVGRLELKREPIDLSLVVEECVDLLGPLARRRNVTLHADPRRAELVADPDRLAQVVTNLLTNAVMYNRAGGEVVVRFESTDESVTMKVSDTGVGVPAEDLPHLFERFYRVDRARARDAGGSGLGLAICQSIIAAHGGEITVASELGRGTTFAVRLPRQPEEIIELE